jgi:CAAX amino terminal protease family.
MNRLGKLASEHPVIFSLVIVVATAAFTEISLKERLTPFLGSLYADYIPGMLEQYLMALACAILAGALGLEGFAAYKRPRRGRTWLLGWPIFLLGAIIAGEAFIGGKAVIDPADPHPYVLLLLFLSTGFYEEGLFRGLLLPLFLRSWGAERKGTYVAVIVTTLLFALTHSINLIQGRYDLVATAAQVVYAGFMGFFFAALALRCGSILPGVILHGLFDFAGNLGELAPNAPTTQTQVFSQSPSDALQSIAILSLFLLYGLFLMRKVGPRTGLLDEGSKEGREA